jgi:hypothetical protein
MLKKNFNKKNRSSNNSSPNGGPKVHHSANTNWGDDEYAQVIEGVKRIYRTKIKPLEVTYNFEGKNSSISRV